MTKLPKIDIGIFGGSGFYSLFENAAEIKIKTPHGFPSDKITIGEIAGRRVAFLPRHGKKHRFPPHKIPYQANLWAFKKLGVTRVIAPAACGSLQKHIKPGDFVICDQFVNRANNREDTFYHGPEVTHISLAEPYCPELRKIAYSASQKLKIKTHSKGTAAIIEGPRFSTKAESRFYQKSGFDVINMTQYPEVALARELEMCYVNISLITDYDAGLIGQKNIKPVNFLEMSKNFATNIDRLKKLIFEIIKNVPEKRNCACGKTLKDAKI